MRWTTFRLPFRTSFATSRGAFAYREGLILRLETDGGINGLGEASPLPERGGGSLQDALALLDGAAEALIGRELEEVGVALNMTEHKRPALAAVSCALDVAACDALARAAGVSVAELLTGEGASSVPVNTTIGASTTAQACGEAAAARAAGFGCVKLKVGMVPSVEEECQRVAAVRNVLGPEVRLRVDSNGAWGVEQAVRTIRALEAYDLEFVEQPVAPGDPGDLRRVREAVRTPIAADEAVSGFAAAQRVLEMGAAQVLVLKPMVVGGLRPALRIAQLARSLGVSVVVTTTIDAGVGTAAALHLAAALPPGGPASGLATGALLAADIITRPLEARAGQMARPQGPGLAVELDQEELRQYSSGIDREVS